MRTDSINVMYQLTAARSAHALLQHTHNVTHIMMLEKDRESHISRSTLTPKYAEIHNAEDIHTS